MLLIFTFCKYRHNLIFYRKLADVENVRNPSKGKDSEPPALFFHLCNLVAGVFWVPYQNFLCSCTFTNFYKCPPSFFILHKKKCWSAFVLIFSLCSNDVYVFYWELISAFPYFPDQLQSHSLQAQMSTEILHPTTLPFALLNRIVAENKMKNLMGGDKARDHLPITVMGKTET